LLYIGLLNYLKFDLVAVLVEENLNSADTKQLASTEKSTSEAAASVDSDLKSSADRNRRRKAILLPDDYHSKPTVRKLENSTLEL